MTDPDYEYDSFIGQFGTYVCVGQCALWRAGLTTAHMTMLQLATRYPELNGLGTWKAKYYFDPWFNKYFETKPSPACSTILEPTQERALLETMYLHENFNEGVLIESIKDYICYHTDLNKLYAVARNYFPSNHKRIIEYWVHEAMDDDSVCGA